MGRRAAVAHPILILDETLVVTADGNQEQQTVDVLEAVNPLLALGSLTSNVEHAIRQLAKVKSRLCNACCS
jgi:hypothetical protein